MSSSGVAGAVTGPVGGLLASLDELAGQEPAVVASAALRADLLALLAATNRLHAELARRVAAADASGSCTADGFRSVGAWLRAFGRLSIASSARLVRAARVLRQLPALATAAGRGDVSAEHIRRVDLLVERVGVDVVRRVEEPLTTAASQVDPGRLEQACERVRVHADPDGPQPDAGEDFARRGITLSPFDGMVLIRGQLDPEGGAALRTALDALTKPPSLADGRTAAQRRADALAELARGALRAGRLPEVGGVRPQVGVLLTPPALTGRGRRSSGPAAAGRPAAGPSAVDTVHRPAVRAGPRAAGAGPVTPRPAPRPSPGPPPSSRPGVPSRPAGGAATSAAGHGGPGSDPLSEAGVPHLPEPAWLDWVGDVPDEVAQRLACDADVWRVVLDPARGQPVEVGRSHRLVPAWLRKALHARDRGCRFPGCGAPSAWSDAHHVVPWARGGRTDAGNLVLLCRWHHSLVHEGGWSVEIDGATGAVTVRRPGGRPFQPPFDPPPSRGP